MTKLTPVPATPTRLLRARELASEAIEKMHDPAALTEEQFERRRRLAKRPPEFPQHRIDLPKTKT
jgi:hypothetical protein